MTSLNKTILPLLALGLMLTALIAAAETRITYQGRLDASGSPFTGAADMRFQLHETDSGDSPVGPELALADVPVSEGLFQVELDFGAEVFTKPQLWLQVTVEGNELIPRQALTAAPLAIHALSAANAGDITGVSAGFGLTGGGSSGSVSLAVDTAQIQQRVSSSCPSGSAIRSITPAGGVFCETDDVGGLTLPFTGSASTPLTGEVLDITNTGSGNAIVARSNYGGTQGYISAIFASHESSSGAGHGIQGRTKTSVVGSAGVRGQATASSGKVYGVYGSAASPSGFGAYFRNTNGYALMVESNFGADILFEGTGALEAEDSFSFRAPNNSVQSMFSVFGQTTSETLMSLDGDGDLFILGSLTQNSNRHAKHDISPVDAQTVLERVRRIPVSTWRYNDDPGTLHMGPMAQDFHVAFGLGDNPTGINALDADGVALAAIQGLIGRIESQQQRIETLEAELASRESRIARRLARLEMLLTGNSLAGAQDDSAPASP